MEPRRIEFDGRDVDDCTFNYDSWWCHHPDRSNDWCPERDSGRKVPTWCPLRQRPALVVLKTGGEA